MKTAPSLAARLGFAEQQRLLIAHQDDVGMCHGANRAFVELCGQGFISCGSAMVPCPWFPELAQLAGDNLALDLGVHLTLTSEWPGYRWRPLSGAGRASGLVDEDGYFHRRVPALRAALVVDAAETELRAQIDAALNAGIDVTHLDTHMGAALVPELLDLYLRLGADYRLPVLFPRRIEEYLDVLNMGQIDAAIYRARAAALADSGQPLVDHFRMTPGVPSEASPGAYRDMVAGLDAGLSFIALHCNAPGDIETIVPERAHWRTDEYRLFQDRDFLDWVAAQDVALIGYRPLRELYRQTDRRATA